MKKLLHHRLPRLHHAKQKHIHTISLPDAGQSFQWRQNCSSRFTGSCNLLQWEVCLQQQQWHRPLVLKAEVTAKHAETASAIPGSVRVLAANSVYYRLNVLLFTKQTA